MKNYDEFPPITHLKAVLTSIPHTALLYIALWKIGKKPVTFKVRRNEVKRKHLISPTLFRNYLIALGQLGILKYKEKDDNFLIKFLP